MKKLLSSIALVLSVLMIFAFSTSAEEATVQFDFNDGVTETLTIGANETNSVPVITNKEVGGVVYDFVGWLGSDGNYYTADEIFADYSDGTPSILSYKAVYTDEVTVCAHSFTNYVSDNNATYTGDGTKTAYCDLGCGETDSVTDIGTMLVLGKSAKVTASQSTSVVKLTWSAVEGATGYGVYAEDDGEWAEVAVLSGTTYRVTGLTAGKIYTFAVKAYAADDENTVFAPEGAEIITATEPAVPAKISATQSESVIKLSWTKSVGATGYRVYQYSASKGKYVVKASVKTTSYRVTGLAAGAAHKFKIKPYVKLSDGTVIWGEASGVFYSATEPKATAKITATQTTSAITLKWAESKGATGYRVYQYSPSKGTYVLKTSLKGTTTYKRTGLKSGTEYIFKIAPYIKLSDGTVIFGAEKAISTATEPKTPKSATAAPFSTAAYLSWKANGAATGYRVYKYSTSKAKFVKIATVKDTYYFEEGLKAGTTYKFRIEPYVKLSNGTVIAGTPTTTITVKTDKTYAYYSDIPKFVDVGKYFGVKCLEKETDYEDGLKLITYCYSLGDIAEAIEDNGKSLDAVIYESKNYGYLDGYSQSGADFIYYYYPSKEVTVMLGYFASEGILTVTSITQA